MKKIIDYFKTYRLIDWLCILVAAVWIFLLIYLAAYLRTIYNYIE